VVSESVADAISDLALRENVDLIAMYSHDRRGIARLIKGSIAEKVQRKSSSDLRVLRPRELA
jgi:nucleotide-binding universal stress UspA family protein